MIPLYQIRADYDDKTIIVYQAYNAQIARAAVAAQKFVPPFSMNRMTWVKPSFLWMMERCGWASKANQECVLAVRITRDGWEEALSHAVLTHPEPHVYASHADWKKQIDAALVNVQWDPERNIRGGKLEHRSIQVGFSRQIVEKYVNEWTVAIEDISERVRRMDELRKEGRHDQAAAKLPDEKAYPLPAAIMARLGMKTSN